MPLTVTTPNNKHVAVDILSSSFVGESTTNSIFNTKHAQVDKVFLTAFFSGLLDGSVGKQGQLNFIYRSEENGPPQGTINAYIESEGQAPAVDSLPGILLHILPSFARQYSWLTAIQMMLTFNDRAERWFKEAKSRLHGQIKDEYNNRVVYIFCVGVHPDFQGKGLGTKFLDEFHAQVDALPEPHAVFLEAGSAGSKRMYERNGYEVLEEAHPANIAPGEVVAPLWPMVRRPRTLQQRAARSIVGVAAQACPRAVSRRPLTARQPKSVRAPMLRRF